MVVVVNRNPTESFYIYTKVQQPENVIPTRRTDDGITIDLIPPNYA